MTAGGWAIGVDVGGTKIAAAAVDPHSGALCFRRQIATRATRPAAEVVAGIVAEIERVAAELRAAGDRVLAVGVGVPELVSPAGEILTSYLLDWRKAPLPREIAAAPVYVASDVRAAALAEARFGAGRQFQQFVYVSIGTGISSTLVVDGVPFAGAHGGAVVLSTGPISVPDEHGGWSRFVLEEYASGPALVRRYEAATGRSVTDARALLAAAEAGDTEAASIIDTGARALGSAIAWLVNVLDPQAIVLGGGLGSAPGRFQDGVRAAVAAHVWHPDARHLPVVPAALGADAGLIGAALSTASHTNVPLPAVERRANTLNEQMSPTASGLTPAPRDRFGGFEQPQRSVDDAAKFLKRLYLTERETMRALGARQMAVANWELKAATPRHMWHDSMHADALRNRVLELRYPRRDVEVGHDPDLLTFLDQLTRAESDAEFALGIYAVLKPALIDAYHAYLDQADELNDAPSIYQITHILIDEQEHLAAIAPVLAGLPPDEVESAQPWVEHLRAHLSAIGGVAGDGPRGEVPATPGYANRPPYEVPRRAVRDPRFSPAVVESPTRPVANQRERQVWYAIDHANEVWAAEVPGAFMWVYRDMPWNFYTDVARWSYDEMRHSLSGIRRLTAWGFEMGVDYPMVGDPYHAILEKGGDLRDVLALLYFFEKDAPAHRQKTTREFRAMSDMATTQDTDYDWADEAIHLKYGYTWLQHMLGEEKERLPEVVAAAGEMWDTWLAERWERGEDGYSPFMERIDARIAEAEREALAAAGSDRPA
ncbi:MAG: ROK family protein [Thermomicrobiales bacterium]